MLLKKFRTSKALLLKIFIMQQKNKLSFNIKLKQSDLTLLSFLWKNGYILGFSFFKFNIYTVFLKKQFKQFSIKFLEEKLNYKKLNRVKQVSILKNPVVLSNKGVSSNYFYNKNIGGFLLCHIF